MEQYCKMSELNVMCKDCFNLANDCKGTTEQFWTGCINKDIAGRKVRITNRFFNNRIGVVKKYLWNTQDYMVMLDDDKWPSVFKRSEFEIIS